MMGLRSGTIHGASFQPQPQSQPKNTSSHNSKKQFTYNSSSSVITPYNPYTAIQPPSTHNPYPYPFQPQPQQQQQSSYYNDSHRTIRPARNPISPPSLNLQQQSQQQSQPLLSLPLPPHSYPNQVSSVTSYYDRPAAVIPIVNATSVSPPLPSPLTPPSSSSQYPQQQQKNVLETPNISNIGSDSIKLQVLLEEQRSVKETISKLMTTLNNLQSNYVSQQQQSQSQEKTLSRCNSTSQLTSSPKTSTWMMSGTLLVDNPVIVSDINETQSDHSSRPSSWKKGDSLECEFPLLQDNTKTKWFCRLGGSKTDYILVKEVIQQINKASEISETNTKKPSSSSSSSLLGDDDVDVFSDLTDIDLPDDLKSILNESSSSTDIVQKEEGNHSSTSSIQFYIGNFNMM